MLWGFIESYWVFASRPSHCSVRRRKLAAAFGTPVALAYRMRRIKVTQTATGATRTASSGTDGGYVLPNLPIGPYMLEVTKDGFTSTYKPVSCCRSTPTRRSMSP